jgi:hypothetical protein
MALTEDRVLVSVNIHISEGFKSIDIEWANRVLRDGEVISDIPHRGAYPVNADGEPDDEVVTAMGFTLAQLLGESLAGAQRSLVEQENINATLLAQNQALVAELTRLKNPIGE